MCLSAQPSEFHYRCFVCYLLSMLLLLLMLQGLMLMLQRLMLMLLKLMLMLLVGSTEERDILFLSESPPELLHG